MAGGSIAAKLAFEQGVAPADLLAPRLVLPALGFLCAIALLARDSYLGRSRQALALAAMCGLLFWLGSWAEFEGLRRLPAATLIVLLVLAPIWVALLRWCLWREPVTRRLALALVTVVAGFSLMVDPLRGGLDPTGVALGLAASLSAALFFLVLDRIRGALPPTLAIPVAIVSAGSVALVVDPLTLPSELGDSSVAPLVLAVGLAAAMWALLLARGFRELDGVTVALVLAAEPACVALVAFLLLGEALSIQEIAGGTITLAAVIGVASGAGEAAPSAARAGAWMSAEPEASPGADAGVRISALHWMREEPIEVTVERLARLGYDGIEVNGEPDRYDEGRLSALLEEHGLTAWGAVALMEGPGRDALHPDCFVREGTRAYLEATVDLVARLGGRVLVCAPGAIGKVEPAADPRAEWAWCVEGMRAIGEYAGERAIKVAIEPVNRFDAYLITRVDQALRLVDDIGLPNVGVCVDTFHLNIEEDDPLAAISSAAGRIFDVHVADSNRKPPGMGTLDWEAIVGTARAAGYEGHLTSEVVYPLDWSPLAASPPSGGQPPSDLYEQISRATVEFLRGLEA
jgi:D-psicose/D-tagatose/L-ribulose 3-epimerase